MSNIAVRESKIDGMKDLIVRTQTNKNVVLVLPDGESWVALNGCTIYEVSDPVLDIIGEFDDFDDIYDLDYVEQILNENEKKMIVTDEDGEKHWAKDHLALVMQCWEGNDTGLDKDQ